MKEINISQFYAALAQAKEMMLTTPIEPTSALKQAASDNGISEKKWMRVFILWAFDEWKIEEKRQNWAEKVLSEKREMDLKKGLI